MIKIYKYENTEIEFQYSLDMIPSMVSIIQSMVIRECGYVNLKDVEASLEQIIGNKKNSIIIKAIFDKHSNEFIKGSGLSFRGIIKIKKKE